MAKLEAMAARCNRARQLIEETANVVDGITGLAESMTQTLDGIGADILAKAAQDTIDKASAVMVTLTALTDQINALQLSIGQVGRAGS
jgi:hypothetical protein